MKIVPIFAYYDVWIGAYWDRARRRLYIFPLPMIGFYIQFKVAADPRLKYRVLIADGVFELSEMVNKQIDVGYVLHGPPFAFKVKPDLFANAYYQWAQAVVLKNP